MVGETRKRALVHYVLPLLLVAAFVEVAGYAAGRVLARNGLAYLPQRPSGYERYLAERDPVLGWPRASAFGAGDFDASGSRFVPAFPDPSTPSCVALFGDSFTWGAEVAPEDAYGNVLAARLGCRVANYGVSGYGTDQALLRYEQLEPDAPIVVLGHFSEDVIRNVNQAHDFLSNRPFGLKPRFVLDGDGTLRLIPLPLLSKEQYLALGERTRDLLPFEYHRPGGPSGLVALRFPYAAAAVRALGHYRIAARLRGEASYTQFYRPQHDSHALSLTLAILLRFVEEAKRRGQHPLVLLIPDVKDLEALRRGEASGYQPLFDELRRRRVDVLSVAEHLEEALGDRPPCDLYFRCSGSHFQPEGYREMAAFVERAIRERGLLPGSAR